MPKIAKNVDFVNKTYQEILIIFANSKIFVIQEEGGKTDFG